jgi:hypothetical protein
MKAHTFPFYCVVGTVAILLGGCSAQSTFDRTPTTGKFSGEPRMVAIAPNTFFFFQPTNSERFAFTTHKSDSDLTETRGRGVYKKKDWKIIPQDMITTGASVPRNLWYVPGFSAFDYTRAAVIHDWLYEAHHRYEIAKAGLVAAEVRGDRVEMARHKKDMEAYKDYANVDQDDAADIFAECIKVTMLQSKEVRDALDYLDNKQAGSMSGSERPTANFAGLKSALRHNRPSPRTLWLYHYFVSKNCLIGTSRNVWRELNSDMAIYQALSESNVARHAEEKGYLSKWLIKKFENVLTGEKKRHEDHERALRQGIVAETRSTQAESASLASSGGIR